MLSIILLITGSFFSEASTSLGKTEVTHKQENIYTYGFLSLFLSTIAFLLIALFRGTFLFSVASLPTLALRVILEIAQAYVSIKAITTADRSTFCTTFAAARGVKRSKASASLTGHPLIRSTTGRVFRGDIRT